jgi:ankyrin repeat protein
LDRAANVNYWDRHSGSTALSATSYIGSLSVVRDHLKVVRALLNYQGVRANIQNNHACTALIKESFNCHSELVQALLNHDGVYVNVQEDDGDTGLICACYDGHVEVILPHVMDATSAYLAEFPWSTSSDACHPTKVGCQRRCFLGGR